jgi:hypothetical protein
MKSWIVTELEFKNTCPDNMVDYIRFIRHHYRYDNRKIHANFGEYVNLIEFGVIATDYGKVLMKERVN